MQFCIDLLNKIYFFKIKTYSKVDNYISNDHIAEILCTAILVITIMLKDNGQADIRDQSFIIRYVLSGTYGGV